MPATVKGIASNDTLDGEPGATECAMPVNCFQAVSRAVWLESTHLHLTNRPKDDLIKAYSGDENAFHNV